MSFHKQASILFHRSQKLAARPPSIPVALAPDRNHHEALFHWLDNLPMRGEHPVPEEPKQTGSQQQYQQPVEGRVDGPI